MTNVTKLGGGALIVNEQFKTVGWVYEGQRVVAPCVLADGRKMGLRCRVAVAAGYYARVVNDRLGVDGWLRIDSLREEAS